MKRASSLSSSVSLFTLPSTRITTFYNRHLQSSSSSPCFSEKLIPTNNPKRLSSHVYAWGSGDSHKLGNGESVYMKKPSLISIFENTEILKLSCGCSHSSALVKSHDGMGQLFTWGSNFYGQSGFMEDRSNFFQIEEEADFVPLPSHLKSLSHLNLKDVSTGNFHNVVLTTDGQLWTWGGGILGQKQEIYDSNPSLITFFNEIKRKVLSISCLDDSTVLIGESMKTGAKEVYVFGYFNISEKYNKNLKTDKLKRLKSIEPSIVASLISADPYLVKTGIKSFAVVAKTIKNNEHDDKKDHILYWFGCSHHQGLEKNEICKEMPGYPYMKDVDIVTMVYKEPPRKEWYFDNLIVDMAVGEDFGICLDENNNLFYFNLKEDSSIVESIQLKEFDTKRDKIISLNASQSGHKIHILTEAGNFYTISSSSDTDLFSLSSVNLKCDFEKLEGIEGKIQHFAVGWDHYLIATG